MAPLPEVIEPAPGPRFGYTSAPAALRYAAPVAASAPTAVPLSEAAAPGPDPAAAAVTPGADPDAWAHASWNAYSHQKPTTDSASLSWEGPAVDIPRPAAMPRELDASRLLTTLPPPRVSPIPSWWRVGSLAAASALLAAFGAVALMPDRSATPVASNLSDVRLELPAAPTASPAAEPSPLAAVVDDDGPLEEEVEEATPEEAAEDAPQRVATPSPPRDEMAPGSRTTTRRWSRPAPRPRGGFLAAIAERKRTMGYIVARATEPCVFYVDGTPHGSSRILKMQVHPGAHRVTCRTESGRQSQSVQVRSRHIASAVFRL